MTFTAFIQTPKSVRVLGQVDAHDALAALDVAKKWYGMDADPWPVCVTKAPEVPDPDAWSYLTGSGTLSQDENRKRYALLNGSRRESFSRPRWFQRLQRTTLPEREPKPSHPRDPSLHEMLTDTMEEDAREAGL